LETWEIVGCYIKDANYQELNYQNNDPVTIQLSIRFDNATQVPGGAGIGTRVTTSRGALATL